MIPQVRFEHIISYNIIQTVVIITLKTLHEALNKPEASSKELVT